MKGHKVHYAGPNHFKVEWCGKILPDVFTTRQGATYFLKTYNRPLFELTPPPQKREKTK